MTSSSWFTMPCQGGALEVDERVAPKVAPPRCSVLRSSRFSLFRDSMSSGDRDLLRSSDRDNDLALSVVILSSRSLSFRRSFLASSSSEFGERLRPRRPFSLGHDYLDVSFAFPIVIVNIKGAIGVLSLDNTGVPLVPTSIPRLAGVAAP